MNLCRKLSGEIPVLQGVRNRPKNPKSSTPRSICSFCFYLLCCFFFPASVTPFIDSHLTVPGCRCRGRRGWSGRRPACRNSTGLKNSSGNLGFR